MPEPQRRLARTVSHPCMRRRHASDFVPPSEEMGQNEAGNVESRETSSERKPHSVSFVRESPRHLEATAVPPAPVVAPTTPVGGIKSKFSGCLKKLKQKKNALKDNNRKTLNIIKFVVFILLWLFCTITFMAYGETGKAYVQSLVEKNKQKHYIIPAASTEEFKIIIEVTGPILSRTQQLKSVGEFGYLYVWVERWFVPETINNDTRMKQFQEQSQSWQIALWNTTKIGAAFSPRAKNRQSILLVVKETRVTDRVMLQNPIMYAVLMELTNDTQGIPVAFTYRINPFSATMARVLTVILILILNVMFVLEVTDKTMIVMFMSTLTMAVLCYCNARPSLSEVVSWIKIDMLMLLFSVMLLVALVEDAGIFDTAAVFIVKIAKNNTWILVAIMIGSSTLFTLFMDNVIVVLMMTPLIVRVCEATYLNPIPILMATMVYCNIGGAVSAVSSPQNQIIYADTNVALEIDYMIFFLHIFVGTIFILLQTTAYIYFVPFKKGQDALKERMTELQHQKILWDRVAHGTPAISGDWQVIKSRLLGMAREGAPRTETADKTLVPKAIIALVIFIVAMVLRRLLIKTLSPTWSSFLCTLLLLILLDKENMEPLLLRIEWSNLILIAAFFVFAEALCKLNNNTTESFEESLQKLIRSSHKNQRLVSAMTLILWVAASFSAFFHNIPVASMMVQVVTRSSGEMNLPMAPLIWALVFGVNVGANCSLMSSNTNLVCSRFAKQQGYNIRFWRFFAFAFPIMIGNLGVSTLYLILCHGLFTWH